MKDELRERIPPVQQFDPWSWNPDGAPPSSYTIVNNVPGPEQVIYLPPGSYEIEQGADLGTNQLDQWEVFIPVGWAVWPQVASGAGAPSSGIWGQFASTQFTVGERLRVRRRAVFLEPINNPYNIRRYGVLPPAAGSGCAAVWFMANHNDPGVRLLAVPGGSSWTLCQAGAPGVIVAQSQGGDPVIPWPGGGVDYRCVLAWRQ